VTGPVELDSADAALACIGPGRRIAIAPGCGAPTTLLAAIGAAPEAIRGGALYSGMLLGEYPFLDAVRERILSYATWHVMPPVADLVADGRVGFYPVRASQVPALLRRLDIDVLLLRVSPPDRHGFCNLGPSVSYPVGLIRHASLVLAEVDDRVPRIHGEGNVHVSELDVFVPATQPAAEYRRAQPNDVSRAIAKHILTLLPDAPTLQIGIGGIPEALVDSLLEHRIGGLRFVGMAIDGFADLHDAGLLNVARLWPDPPVSAAEFMGSRRLMDFADANPCAGGFSTRHGISAAALGSVQRLVSVNSAIEVDQWGQVSAERLGGRQVSGVGGSTDFVEAAMLSPGGVRIVALPAATLRGPTSRIVPRFRDPAPVNLTRSSVEYVVTQYGIADLAAASERERAEALAAIADPAHADELLRTETVHA
jgi:4-hydroxybutyrate CoA-transferase